MLNFISGNCLFSAFRRQKFGWIWPFSKVPWNWPNYFRQGNIRVPLIGLLFQPWFARQILTFPVPDYYFLLIPVLELPFGQIGGLFREVKGCPSLCKGFSQTSAGLWFSVKARDLGGLNFFSQI